MKRDSLGALHIQTTSVITKIEEKKKNRTNEAINEKDKNVIVQEVIGKTQLVYGVTDSPPIYAPKICGFCVFCF